MTREEAIKKLQKQKAEYLEEWVDYSGVAEAYDMAIEALSAEAVEVVRCEDCKHHEKFLFDDSKVLCWVHDTDIVVSPTDYCSYGERREDGEE